MAKQVNLIAEVDSVSSQIIVTAAAGSAGTAIPVSIASSAVTLTTMSLYGGVEYQVGSGAWVFLEKNEGNVVNVDLSTTTVKMRLIADGATAVQVEVVVDSLPTIRQYPGGPSISASGVSAQIQSAVTKNVPVTGAGAVSSASYSRLKAAAAKVKNGTANMRICRGGDSTELGSLSLGSGTPIAGNRAVSPAVFFTAALNQSGLPANCDSFIGDGALKKTNATALGVYDTRITKGTFDGSSTVLTAGGGTISDTAGTTPMNFLPLNPVDTVEVYYATNAGLGSFALSRTGDAANPTISQVGASGVGKYTFTGALGNVNGLNLARVSGGVYVIGEIAYNSAVKSIQVVPVSWSGGTTTDWTDSSTGFAALSAEVALAADFWLWRPGINEWNQSIPVATFQAKLDLLVSSLLVGSDVALATPYPSRNTSFTLALQKTYVDAIFAVAAKYNLAVNDTWSKVASWEQGNAFGYYGDNLHPQRPLYQLAAESDANFVLSLIG